MKKSAFNMVEIAVVICLLITTIVACLPAIFNNTREAKIISRWKQLYAETKSNFEIFSINDLQSVEKICTMDIENKDEDIFIILSPYLNVNKERGKEGLKYYNYKFSNGAQIPMQSAYFAKNFYYQDSGSIVGFKWQNCRCSDTKPCATAVFDMNGEKGPNRLGQDVFGINLYKNGIRAFGSDLSNPDLEKECSKGIGSGAVCSEFFLRGGKF